MLLRMTDIHKFYNGRQVLSHVSLTVEDHDRIGLVGVNGCGKSTLLRILTGQELPDHLLEGDGEIAKSAKTSIGYLEQMGGLDRESTVWAEMRSVFRPLLGICLQQRSTTACKPGSRTTTAIRST